jgi:hypothetical protein
MEKGGNNSNVTDKVVLTQHQYAQLTARARRTKNLRRAIKQQNAQLRYLQKEGEAGWYRQHAGVVGLQATISTLREENKRLSQSKMARIPWRLIVIISLMSSLTAHLLSNML